MLAARSSLKVSLALIFGVIGMGLAIVMGAPILACGILGVVAGLIVA